MARGGPGEKWIQNSVMQGSAPIGGAKQEKDQPDLNTCAEQTLCTESADKTLTNHATDGSTG